MILTASRRVLICALLATASVGCGGGGQDGANGGGSGGTGTGGFGGAVFNGCGVAAPLPVENGQCKVVTAPAIASFDDYAPGTPAGSYAYHLNGQPPAADAVLGGILHIGDGSDMNGGTSVIATEMVTGAGNAGYALQISNSQAVNWGGTLLFFFPQTGTTPTCLDARNHRGVAFSIKGSSPSGRFGVSVGMRDTIPVADNGLCDNASAGDCKNATIEMTLPSDPTTWTQLQVPWGAFTPGVGSGRSCVPLTGQNIVHLAIQPFMSYPPPNYTLQPGPYTIAVDDVRFF